MRRKEQVLVDHVAGGLLRFRLMSWLSEMVNATAAFEEWARVDRERRAFLRLALEFAAESYQRLWDKLGQEPGDGESELVDVFDDRIDGLWPHDY
jgi:hypothetical protein